ncbi:MAG: DUF302 domain-containing protein [Acidimicrobiia bacterium]|nr:DUF302 domain-containing protein [Acidimicrobiia bacterium]
MKAFEATVDAPIERAEVAVREALAEAGFGVLTEIDVAATLKAKIGVDRPPMKILGACNPTFAHQALELDPGVAVLLPCNAVVEEVDGGTRVSLVDPRELMPDPRFAEVAQGAAERLEGALRETERRLTT